MKIDLLSKAQLSIINKNNLKYPLATAEKDYILAIVLHIIYNTSLKDKLIFKGGTAIHHIYLDQLRFSEDLDFSSVAYISIQDIEEAFNPYSFLEVISYHESQFALKIERMKYYGPLEQPNSIKIDIDLTQELLLPPVRMNYNNYYKVPVSVQAMNILEICAEKLRAINERARYRDFYDLTFVVRNHTMKEPLILLLQYAATWNCFVLEKKQQNVSVIWSRFIEGQDTILSMFNIIGRWLHQPEIGNFKQSEAQEL